MYAKTLVPGPNPVPALMATTDEADVLIPQLRYRGWTWFGDRAPISRRGVVLIEADRLRLMVDAQALLDDLNPYAPDGWWLAVDAQQGHCLVVIASVGALDLEADEAGEQLAALIGKRAAVSATLPVVTSLDG